MDVKHKKFGFTLVEILTVLGIIALLVGLLIPALSMVRKVARETKQKAQLTGIDLTLTAFKNDYGDYPYSDQFSHDTSMTDYCGAQKLAEALLGRDLLGFNKYSDWSATDLAYYPTDLALLDDSLDNRIGPYLEIATANAFRLGINLMSRQDPDGLFDNTGSLHPDRFVLCDVFGIPERRITLANGEVVTPGTPILYYRANTSNKTLDSSDLRELIYNISDNGPLIGLGKIGDVMTTHPLLYMNVFYGDPTVTPPVIGYIQDPKVMATPWPYRPDSYILISAGADGLYGTGDDITNFGN